MVHSERLDVDTIHRLPQKDKKMDTATQVQQERMVFYPNMDITILHETLIQSGELIIDLMLHRLNQPDFYTVERDDTEDCYTSLDDVCEEIQKAIVGEYVHFCAQAHYLLPVGDGEVSITLFLADE